MFFWVGKCYAFSKYVYNNPTLLIFVDLEKFFHPKFYIFFLPEICHWASFRITDFLLLFRNAVKMKCRTTRQKVNRKNWDNKKNPFKVEEHPSIFLKSCNFSLLPSCLLVWQLTQKKYLQFHYLNCWTYAKLRNCELAFEVLIFTFQCKWNSVIKKRFLHFLVIKSFICVCVIHLCGC